MTLESPPVRPAAAVALDLVTLRPRRAPDCPRGLTSLEGRGSAGPAANCQAAARETLRLSIPSFAPAMHAWAKARPTPRYADLVAQGGNDRARLRSAASSVLTECGRWHADAVERQLAHVDNDSVRRACARADVWDERVRMMTWWAHRCRELRDSGIVVRRAPDDSPSNLSAACSCNPRVCRITLRRAIVGAQVCHDRYCRVASIDRLGRVRRAIPRKRHRPLGRS